MLFLKAIEEGNKGEAISSPNICLVHEVVKGREEGEGKALRSKRAPCTKFKPAKCWGRGS
jgi:hypothetical protein